MSQLEEVVYHQDAVMEVLRRQISASGGQAAWAKLAGLSPQYVNDIVQGGVRSAPGDLRVSRNPYCQRGLIMARTLFTADLHVGHENILRFCDRPFATIEEHDRVLVELWNSVVAPGDIVYVVGDFAHKMHPRDMRRVFDSLRGTKHLVSGNHDSGASKSLPWASVTERLAVSVDGQRLLLDHYPSRSWHGSNRGTIQLFGHTHGRLPDLWNAADVGVDRWNYMPVDLPQILARLAEIPRPADEVDEELEDEPAGPKI